jgi:hypothetical protein
MWKNEPYVKRYENGICVNPITKENPYVQLASEKQIKRQRKSTNRKGNGLVVVKIGATSFMKFRRVKQLVGNRLIVHDIAV